MTMDLHIPLSGSLKSKRSVLKSLKDRVRSRFNVSVAEVGEQDKWQRCLVAVSMICDDKAVISRGFEGIVRLVEESGDIQLLRHRTEFV